MRSKTGENDNIAQWRFASRDGCAPELVRTMRAVLLVELRFTLCFTNVGGNNRNPCRKYLRQ
jgi:hypothetical protein